MTEPRPSSSAGIIWDFSVTEQGHVARYGHASTYYYKQYMPYGLELTTAHPPQRIDVRVYDMVKRFVIKTVRPSGPF